MLLTYIVVSSLLFIRPARLQSFPADFKFGVATASYQIEGAWKENGKGENIWDRVSHEHPEWIKDRSNGDIACDSYHKYEEDIGLMKYLGVDFYRFSLSWSRLFPTGYVNRLNPDGVRYYNDVINALVREGVTPVVTLYHWDLPQPLQEIGGWPNPLLKDYFADYAREAFKLFGDRVKHWITFNEPPEVCQSGYGVGTLAPGYKDDGIAPYLCGKTLLLSHAAAWRIYDTEFRKSQGGKVGITINARWMQPKTNSTEDLEAAQRTMLMDFGWWSYPIFSEEGDYPAIMKERIANISKKQGFPRSRLPEFTSKEVEFIRGTQDFLGLNHYTSSVIEAINSPVNPNPSFANDIGVHQYQDPSWPSSAASWLKSVPWGFRKLLNWIKKTYNDPLVYITENGFADTGTLTDTGRIEYMKGYLTALSEAIELDGCNVRGYTHWSLIDNYEWFDGYTLKFGLVQVDFNNPNRTRTLKSSAAFYKKVIATRTIPSDP